ncbi:MAG TPA: hypothetical protein VF596_09770 [Pyrinomonadaceae bacterium]|jgi:HTH-type transcriptional regulator/antitoxin HigA
MIAIQAKSERSSGKFMMTYDRQRYGALLAATLPVVIESEDDYKRLESVVEDLLAKGEHLSPEEEKLLNLVSELVADYEDKNFHIEKGEPVEILRFLIEENSLKQKDLLPVFGSEGIISEILKGKRGITAKHAKLLGEFFSVSPELFI